ncbi:MAG: hypothetical protein L6R38_005892 [Xanthoria sp. 2 TBL-2021]|nr:MAG: hypothetical protein L6R38_005892 [Xanthoria sp. 2 TBL-2021]
MASPTKKRRLRSSSGQAKLDFNPAPLPTTHKTASNKMALPTPEPSSQIEAQHETVGAQSLRSTSSSQDDEPITPRKSGRRRTGFMGTHTPLDQEKRKEDKSIHRRGPSPLHPTIELGASDESDIPSPRKRAHKTHRASPQTTPRPSVTVISEEESEPIPVKSTKRGLRKPQIIPRTPQSSRRRRSPTSSSSLRFKQVSVPINRLPSNTAITPTRSPKRANTSRHRDMQSTEQQGQSSSRPRRPAEPESDDSSDSLMNELRVSSSKPEQDLSDPYEDTEDSNDHVVKTSRRRRRKPYIEISSSVDRSDPEEGQPRLKGRPKRGEKHREFTRAKTPATERSTRQKQLDLLRKRRAGEAVDHLSNDDDLEIYQQDSEPDADSDGPVELEDEEDSGTERVRRAIPPNLDEYEEDFVDDDDDTIGAPADLADIPLEFTRHAHKKPIEHFKDVVEWMVHNRLNPAFARNDPVYTIAVRKLDDVVQGYAGSKFMSSAWKPEFTEALKKYPDCIKVDVPTMFDQKCEACGRSGHPAKHRLTFSGKPYHRDSLEDISSDEEEDSDEPESDSQLPQSHVKVFFLGRTCNANAETAHALHHWRHQLNEFVLILLRSEGHLSSEKIIEMNGWNIKKKEKYANGVVDGMEANGQMKDLYREFKQNIEVAREAKNDGNYFYGRKG